MTSFWLQLFMVLLGIVLLVVALVPALRILQQSPAHVTNWKALLGLIVFFILGYIAFGYFLYNNPEGVVELVVTLVFVGGAAFVLLVMFMSYRAVRHEKEVAARESHRALHDDLTGLPNRTLLRERMLYTIAMSKRESGLFSILLMDLDRFKDVNDTLGHASGDILLKLVAPRLRSLVRESDTVVRLGGDEFVVLLPGTGLTQAIVVAEKLVGVLEQPFEVNNHHLSIGVSIGICVYPMHGHDVDTLLQHADIAMYNAKRRDASNASYAIYDIDQNQRTLEGLTLTGGLREAIRNGELTVHYQPKVLIHDHRLCGVEALVRWQHPKLGLIPPIKFIPLAEQTGQITTLTRWLLNATLQQYDTWRRSGLRIPIAVNISPKDLRDVQFAEHVRELLNRWNVPAEDITLEFTESSMIGDSDRTTNIISRLYGLGLKLSIDDFGTGYSSLAYLKQLPIPEIKIDRSFVKDMETDENDAIIVRSIINLAHNMGLEVTAEGVETKEVLELLDMLGCDRVQGYHIARPLTAEQLMGWIKTNSGAKLVAAVV